MIVQMELSMPNLCPALASKTVQGLGKIGELLAYGALAQSQYRVTQHSGRADLRAVSRDDEVFEVEVKTARMGKDGKWRFLLVKDRNGKRTQDHRYADFVLLQCVLDSGRLVRFLVPAKKLKGRQAVITSHPDTYAGKLAPYRVDGALVLEGEE